MAEHGWRAPFLLYLVAFALLPFFLRAIQEPPRPPRATHTPAPTVRSRPDLALTRLVIFVYGMMLLNQAAFYLAPLHIPAYLELRYLASPTQSGLALSLIPLAFALGSLLYRSYGTRWSHVLTAGMGLALNGAGFILVGLAPVLTLVYAGLSLCGLGIGLLIPNLNLLLANAVPHALRGRLLGGFSAALYLGQVLSPLLFQPRANVASLSQLWILVGFGLGIVGLALGGIRQWRRRPRFAG